VPSGAWNRDDPPATLANLGQDASNPLAEEYVSALATAVATVARWIVTNSRQRGLAVARQVRLPIALRYGLSIALTTLASTCVQAQTLELAPGERREYLASIVRYARLDGTPSGTLAEVRRLPASAYGEIDSRYIDFGYTDETIWL
jgi:hypothetical protein